MIKKFLILFFVIVLPFIAFGQSGICDTTYVNFVVSQADSFRAMKDRSQHLGVLLKGLDNCPENAQLLSKTALLYLEMGDTDYNNSNKISKEQRLEYFYTGLNYARKANRIDSTSDKAAEMISTAFAAIISASGLRNQARLADSVRVYAEKALELNPNNDRAYHILGRWHFEVSNISSWILFFSDIFFGTAPEGNINQSIDYFTGALNLDDYPIHNYWLARALLRNGESEKAKSLLEHLLGLPDRFHNDGFFKSEAKKLLESM